MILLWKKYKNKNKNKFRSNNISCHQIYSHLRLIGLVNFSAYFISIIIMRSLVCGGSTYFVFTNGKTITGRLSALHHIYNNK